MHLGSIAPQQTRAFYGWLEAAARDAAWIVLNGDLFDFWFEYRRDRHTRGHDEALERLRHVTDQGVRVTLLGGNHDWWGGPVLERKAGVEFVPGPLRVELAGLKTFVAHGDGLGRGDLIYRAAVRPLLRGRLTRWAFGCLPPAVGDAVARGVSRTHERWSPPGPRELERAAALRAWAHDLLRRDMELDIVILGHTHVPECTELEPRRWYANAGDWVVHRSYLVLEPGEPPRLAHWEGDAP